MAGGVENLKPVQSKEEARERGRNGGKRSGEVRKQQKTMRELMKMLLSLPATEKEKEKLNDLGVPIEEQSQKTMVAVGLLRQAKTGDHNAVKTLCGISGDLFTIPKDEEENPEFNLLEELKGFKVEFVDARKKERGRK